MAVGKGGSVSELSTSCGRRAKVAFAESTVHAALLQDTGAGADDARAPTNGFVEVAIDVIRQGDIGYRSNEASPQAFDHRCVARFGFRSKLRIAEPESVVGLLSRKTKPELLGEPQEPPLGVVPALARDVHCPAHRCQSMRRFVQQRRERLETAGGDAFAGDEDLRRLRGPAVLLPPSVSLVMAKALTVGSLSAATNHDEWCGQIRVMFADRFIGHLQRCNVARSHIDRRAHASKLPEFDLKMSTYGEATP